MREWEAGFTLVEMVIAVAIAAVLLAAGGIWMLSMRPGAVHGAINDFDGALAAARQLAATSGNGATLAFVPRTDGAQGFVLRVYSGRPNVANAVKGTTIRNVVSNATITETTYGSPPFSIFLNSAGYPTGKASYPSVDASGNVSFPVIAAQPACPANDITLTFHSVQGPTETRTLKCNVAVRGNAAPNPSPTPNLPHITPPSMVAHWTNDRGGALRFKVAEFGYTGQFAKSDTACDAIATFAANPVTPSSATNPDEPVANFELYPIPGAPGLCNVGVADSYGQTVHSSVQIMGDLTWENPQPTPISMKPGDSVTLQFGKSYDSEPLRLGAGGNCRGVVTPMPAPGGMTQSSPSTAATTANLQVNANAQGGCTLLVGDQYGEPTVPIPINVSTPTRAMNSWPAGIMYPVPGSTVVAEDRSWSSGLVIAQLLGGAVARAYAPCGANQPAAFNGDPLTAAPLINAAPPASWNAKAWSTDSNGCLLYNGARVDATTGPSIVVNESGYAEQFSIPSESCNASSVGIGLWSPSQFGPIAALNISPLAPTSSCTITFGDSGGNTTKSVAQVVGCPSGTSGYVPDGSSCTVLSQSVLTTVCTDISESNTPASDVYVGSFAPAVQKGDVVTSGPYGTITNTGTDPYAQPQPPSVITFNRTASGTVTLYLYQEVFGQQKKAVSGTTTCLATGPGMKLISTSTIN